MKGVEVYHKIKASLSNGNSIRQTAGNLGISAGTVQKYSKMDLETSASYLKKTKRKSQFDIAYTFIEEELEQHSKLKSTKLLRKVKAKYPEIDCQVRALRDFVKPIRDRFKGNKQRFYHPVINRKDGSQVQVDPGEFTIKVDKHGKTKKVYFVVFVFSYSRMMFVSFQDRPYKTDDFLKAHLEAFRYFGGVAKEYVYDQTKLVVIEEKYREVWFNAKFSDFALKYEFLPVICEGYDPESKGKVERCVSYVKDDFLYGDYFADIEEVRKLSRVWFSEVANVRMHATTNRKPVEMFEEEKPYLKTNFYLKDENVYRRVDKTGLISFEGNKYSVPFSYQGKQVLVMIEDRRVIVRSVEEGKELATHQICSQKNQIMINNNHYRDIKKSIETVKNETLESLKDISSAEILLSKILEDNPKYIRDQLVGIQKLSGKFPMNLWKECLPKMLELDVLKTSIVEKMLIATKKKKDFILEDSSFMPTESTLDRSPEIYMKSVKNA